MNSPSIQDHVSILKIKQQLCKNNRSADTDSVGNMSLVTLRKGHFESDNAKWMSADPWRCPHGPGEVLIYGTMGGGGVGWNRC